MLRGDVAHGTGFAVEDRRKNTVIRRNEKLLFAAHQQRAALSSHAGIDNDDVNRARRKIAICVGYGKRPVEDIERRDVMVDVHDSRGGVDRQDYALHGPDEVIARAKISGESNDGVWQRNSPFIAELRRRWMTQLTLIENYRAGTTVSRMRARVAIPYRGTGVSLTLLCADDILEREGRCFTRPCVKDHR